MEDEEWNQDDERLYWELEYERRDLDGDLEARFEQRGGEPDE